MTVRGNALRPRVCLAALVLLSSSAVLGQPTTWTIEVIGEGAWPAAAVDESLRTHVCYSNPANTLVHSYRDNVGWHTSIVDQAASGEIWDKSMTRGNNGTLHVAYLGGRLSPYDFIGYAYHDIDGWHAEHLETTYPVWGPSLAIDSELRPHVVYPIMLGMNVLRHAWKDIVGWHFEMVADIGVVSTDIAIDGSDQVHVAYSEEGDLSEALTYAVKGASGWTFEGVDTDTYLPGVLCPSLALDGAGNPHISYIKTDDYMLRYASKTTGSWVIETVVPTGSDMHFSSLCLDGAGEPRIVYWDATAGMLRYACKTPGGWIVASIDSSSGAGRDGDLTLDLYGNPHVAYDDTTDGVVRLARAGIPLIVNDYGSSYELSWGPIGGTLWFWIYGAVNAPYFVPGLDSPYEYRITVLGAANSTWSTTLGLDVEDNYTFRVIALDVNNHEIARSSPAGEFDFLTELP